MRTRHAIGHVLRTRRVKLGLTLREVNQHISYAYLSEVERGKKDISADLLDVLTKSLEFSRAEFMIQVAKVLEEGANEPAGL
jgi:transcriptional regulator with XRE-family HTH domain